ncbi:MAG: hypothetical protein AB1847_20990 [bacterium]
MNTYSCPATVGYLTSHGQPLTRSGSVVKAANGCEHPQGLGLDCAGA